jgi:chemotaxis-related protein WspB
MLLLLFYIEDERYAIKSQDVIEILPLTTIKKSHQTPDMVSGLIHYRDRLVPILDVCRLIRGTPCRPYLSTRIILVNVSTDQHSPRLLGLLTERVTQTLHLAETQLVASSIHLETAAYLAEVFADEDGLIQCLRVEGLLSEEQLVAAQP